MACCMRLATLLAICLPVGGFISPCLVAVVAPISRSALLQSPRCCSSTGGNSSSSNSNSSVNRSNNSRNSRRSRSSSHGSTRSARFSPPRAIGPGGWSADEVTAAREALINSEGFETLVKRAADRLHRDEVHEAAEGRSSSAAMRLRMGTARGGVGSSTEGGTTSSAELRTTTMTAEEDATGSSRTRAGEWKRNADKLKSLRTTVLESGRARDIAGKLLGRLDNNNSRNHRSTITSGRNAHRSEVLHAASSRRPEETIQDSLQQGPNMAERHGAMESAAVATEGGGGRGEAGPRPPGIRWFRRIATRMSHMGRRARGRVARVYGTESGTADDIIRGDA